ncbi:ABC transporter ATP-binding protein [Microbacterium natoriense]
MRTSVPLLSVRDLSITHADAVDPSPAHLSFDIHAGEVVLLLGPSGSGKSTLTLATNGLIPHAVPATLTGTVEVGVLDAATTPTPALSTQIAMVFQDPDAQIVTGTVYDEVAFGPENLLLPLAEVERRTEDALHRIGLWERRSDNPDVLSGGGRQRLAIACALAMGSPLIVLDEPTANLDPQGIDDVYDALADVVSAGDRAILLVEHNLDAAMGFATRVIVLDRAGRLAFDGPAASVLRDNVDELVAMGVWLPAATLEALRMRDAGVVLDPLPLTAAELGATLASAPSTAPDADVSSRYARSTTSGTAPACERGSAATETKRVFARSTTMSPVIRARGLTVRKGRREILHGLDLDVAAGSLTAIVGTNGAGKTTLIQALAGVVPPPKGQVDIAGLDPARASPRELAARIGFVFQNPEHQFIAHTVFDELAHGALRQAQGPRLDAQGPRLDARGPRLEEDVREMLARFGLEDKADRHPFLLSGGEKRRLSVGTALITRPQVLALDEPTFGQDRARAAELLGLLDDLRRDGTTIVIVTHDLQLVAEHATHTVILADGRVHDAGPTDELFRRERTFTGAGLRLPALQRMQAELS